LNLLYYGWETIFVYATISFHLQKRIFTPMRIQVRKRVWKLCLVDVYYKWEHTFPLLFYFTFLVNVIKSEVMWK
jgi:hypothetical protein